MTPSSLAAVTPSLSLSLRTFSTDDPGSWEPLLERARIADAAGIDRLVVPDHVVFGEDLDVYAKPELGGSVVGKQPTGPDGHWLEPLTLLSVIAGMTTHAVARDGHPYRRAPPSGDVGQVAGDARCAVGWARRTPQGAPRSWSRAARSLLI